MTDAIEKSQTDASKASTGAFVGPRQYGPRLDIIKEAPASVVYDAAYDYLMSGDKKELWIYVALAFMSVTVVHHLHHEARMKYALGFHIRHL